MTCVQTKPKKDKGTIIVKCDKYITNSIKKF